MNKWEKFKRKFIERFPEEDPQLLDYIAVYDIIRLVVSGTSNRDIADILYESEDYVESVTLEFLDFSGYKENLDFSPILQYQRLINRGKQYPFFSQCERFLDIKRKVDDYYARN
jgi:hypothetical protein